ncbi:hypothetical protein BAE44_0023897 [Dichanthelium oligosanthes]|uniref:Non-haem dioxygenase N-terminal domain-containing protein n=1 Tax=Dichanthelium oligosanthes TaxID=888268 RepID=A0A1E5UQE1_9POAL|nr:hypothetical protein BAE44_0023897 [Dichanthelium oligosanthes]
MESFPLPADRAALLKAFDESRTGVRGLVETGVSSVPAIFLHPDPYPSVPLVPATAEAAHDWGFFYVINYSHLLPALFSTSDYPARMLAAVRAFNELPGPERDKHYCHASADVGSGVSYYSNVDLFRSPSVSWHDNMDIAFLKAQGLGLQATALEEASCLEGRVMVCHYDPVCPEPKRTMGIVPHTDPGVLVVLA